MTDLPDRILAAIATHLHLAHEHHLGQCTVWTEGWQLKPGPCNCYGPDEVRRHCEADKRTVERHAPHILTNSARKPQPIICSYCSHVPDAVEWPCPDLLDRAAAYDIEAS